MASLISTVGHMKVGSSPYGSVSQDRMLAIRIGMSSGYVSFLVNHTSNSTSRLSVRDRTSGCGHVRMCTRCSSRTSHQGQWSCSLCLRRRITVSSLIYLEINFWNGKEARLRALTILDQATDSCRIFRSLSYLRTRYSTISLWCIL